MSSTSSLNTINLHEYVQRWQAGDQAAANRLCESIGKRLEELARRMLRGYPNVRAWADTADIFQGAVFRLLRTLRQLRPASTRDFYNLAAVHVRRELIELARKFRGKPLPGSGPPVDEDSNLGVQDREAVTPEDLDLWTRFHQAVELLDPEEREVFCLSFYHRWTQPQIAELMQESERTVRRRLNRACINLTRLVGGTLPPV